MTGAPPRPLLPATAPQLIPDRFAAGLNERR